MAQESPDLEDRIKQRLTGAAILVALVVLVVPEMFHGQRAEVPERRGDLSGPPPHTFIINLNDRAPIIAPPASPSPPSSAAPRTGAAGVGPGQPATMAPSGAAAVQAPAITVGQPGPAAVPAGWTVQLGSFSQPQNAHRLMQRLSSKGLTAQLVGPDGHGFYRVRTAVLANRGAAAALQQRLALQGFQGVISTTQ